MSTGWELDKLPESLGERSGYGGAGLVGRDRLLLVVGDRAVLSAS